MAPQSRDDGFHEIQLNGKQLVFLFMAVTVVSAVIFLCGVLVGRGVRAERAALAADATVAPPTTPDLPKLQPPVVSAPAPGAPAPPPAGDNLDYFNRLTERKVSDEHLKVGEKAAPPVAVVRPPEKTPTPADKPRGLAAPVTSAPPSAPAAARASEASTVSSGEPSSPGFALQVTALKEQGEAEAVAKRLKAKGYTVYVLKPAAGSPSVYRVRVGKFKTRREAEAIATKLNKEEQFTPWITR